eukprot:5801788-Pyramimonas_sp.AAC.1
MLSGPALSSRSGAAGLPVGSPPRARPEPAGGRRRRRPRLRWRGGAWHPRGLGRRPSPLPPVGR